MMKKILLASLSLVNVISASDYMLNNLVFEASLGDATKGREKDVILYPREENHRHTVIWLHGIGDNGL